MTAAKRIAFVLPYPYVDSMGCYREPVALFADRGWDVDLYTTASPMHPVPYFGRECVRLRFVSHTRRGMARLVGGLIAARPRYRCVVAASPWGLHYSALTCRVAGLPLVYLHDEIPSEQHEQSPVGRKWRARERRAHSRCRFTITLSRERGEYIRQVNGLRQDHRIYVLPNGYRGEPHRRASRYYRDRLGIADGRRILLHSGGLAWRLANELASAAARWRDGWALVFQGRLKRPDASPHGNGQVFYSDAVLPADLMHYATSSADIGVALYENLGPQEMLMGMASGKIGLYLHNGLPVITTDQPCYAWIEEFGCGVRVGSVADVLPAACEIARNYLKYSEGALEACRRKYNVDASLDEIYGILDQASIQ